MTDLAWGYTPHALAYRRDPDRDIDTAMSPPLLLIMADVDGTLLDDSGRLPCEAAALRERLSQLAETRGGAVVMGLASSRTLRELLVLQRALGMRGPCIAEDGGVLAVDVEQGQERSRRRHGAEAHETVVAGRRALRVWTLGDSTDALRAALPESLSDRALTAHDTRGLDALGFRTPAMRRRAIGERGASVLLDLRGVDGAGALAAEAQARGIDVRRGGRWHTVTRGASKGAALRLLRRIGVTVQGTWAHDARLRVAAIGNEENDEALLLASDDAFAISNPGQGVHPTLAAVPHVRPLAAEGTRGVLEMLDLLEADTPAATRGHDARDAHPEPQ